MTEQERILLPILDLQKFAQENHYYGLIEGLSVALEVYIDEASLDENVKTAALSALSARS